MLDWRTNSNLILLTNIWVCPSILYSDAGFSGGGLMEGGKDYSGVLQLFYEMAGWWDWNERSKWVGAMTDQDFFTRTVATVTGYAMNAVFAESDENKNLWRSGGRWGVEWVVGWWWRWCTTTPMHSFPVWSSFDVTQFCTSVFQSGAAACLFGLMRCKLPHFSTL